jgi:small subunit ribosomal protein S17
MSETEQAVINDQADVEAPEAAVPSDSSYGRSGDRNYRKVRTGYVVSDKMDKTVVVAIEAMVKHRLYGKIMRRTSKLKAHDEQNSCGVGDRVLLMETRPTSATKRWRVVEILEKAK